jgi:dipeptidyl aminopeptidase/acylaminoacyl peptidase
MRKTLEALLCLATLVFPTARARGAETTRLLKPEDFAAIREVGDPQISPDGSWVAYTVRTIDLAKDKTATNLWMAKWDGSQNLALTFGQSSQSHPRWSPDGRYLAFLSGRGDAHEKDQIWLLNRQGGEAEKTTDLAGGIEDFAWSPDGARMALVVRDPDPNAPPPGQEKPKKTPPPIVIDRFQFKQDIQGYLTDLRVHIDLFDLASRKVDPLTSGPHDDLLPSWSPDGREIAFVTKRGVDPDRTEDWNVYVIAARAGAHERQLTSSPEADDHPDWDSSPAWSPDGKWIAYLHGGDPKLIEYATRSLAIIPASGGEARILTPKLDRNMTAPRFSRDGKWIYFRLEEDRVDHVARIPATGGPVATVVGGWRVVRAFDLGNDGRLAVLASTTDRPYEVFAAGQEGLRDLSKQNDAFLKTVRLGKVEETSFKSKDGTEIHGFVTLPPNHAAGRRGPALLRPHGGPQAQYGSSFNFEAQLLGAAGYVVITPNPRGSTGRGTDYGKAIYADWGHKDVEDDLAAVDDAVARGLADPDRLGVGGWSYGGMSTNYIIATTDRFKAATSGASISNILAGYGTDEYVRDYQYELGVPWKHLDAWMRISFPFYHADRIKTPTLFLGGDKDFNVPLLNGEQMYQALRSLGVPTELIIYPGQFHGLRKPSYVLDRYRRYIDWYAKWIASKPEGER